MASQSVRRRRTPPMAGAWSVVLIDGEPIRRKARRDYEKVLRDLEKAKAETERFEAEDKPRFAKWLNANFGALLTEIRELQEKLFQAESLVNEVQQEFYFGDYRSINKAYQKVMRRRNHPEEEEKELGPDEQEAEEFRREFEEAFADMEQEFAREQERHRNKRAGAGRQHAAEKPGSAASRVKDIYRKLVRLLHPDKGAKRTAKEVEWWHQTQEAYEGGNLEQLELILTLVEMEHKGSKEATVSVLGQLTLEFRKSLKALKKRITDLKKDIAWGFSQLSDFSGLMQRTRLQLTADRDRIAWLLQKYESQIKSWEVAAAAPNGKRTRARRGAWQDEEWF